MRAYGVGDDLRLDCRLTESDLATDLHVSDALFANEAVDESLLHAEASCRALFVDERIGVEELPLLGVSRGCLRCRAGLCGHGFHTRCHRGHLRPFSTAVSPATEMTMRPRIRIDGSVRSRTAWSAVVREIAGIRAASVTEIVVGPGDP